MLRMLLRPGKVGEDELASRGRGKRAFPALLSVLTQVLSVPGGKSRQRRPPMLAELTEAGSDWPASDGRFPFLLILRCWWATR